jgi:hypothetical protein
VRRDGASAGHHAEQVYHCKADRVEQMIGSYIPNPTGEPYTMDFKPVESPSGVLARSMQHSVRSRVVDDDGNVFAGALCTFPILHAIDFPRQIGSGLSNSRRSGDSRMPTPPRHLLAPLPASKPVRLVA